MTSDSSVEIRITGTVDRSLEASTEQAIAQIGKIAEAVNQQDLAPAWIEAADDIRNAYAKLGDDIAAVNREVAAASSESAKESADAQKKTWEDANKAVLSSEASLVRD